MLLGTLKEQSKNYGLDIVVYEQVPASTNAWGPILSKIRAHNPSLIFLSIYAPESIAAFADQFTQNPTNSLVDLGYAVSIPSFMEIAGRYATGITGYGALGAPPKVTAEGRAVEERYMQMFDIEEIAGEQLKSTRASLGCAGASLASLPRWSPVLDIGCACGHFLNKLRGAMSERQFIGVDVSRRMTEKGRAEFDLDLRGRAFETAGLPPGCFGLVTAFDVLEHVVSPGDVLAKMLRLLHPNGWGVLEVPSERTIFRTVARAAFQMTAGTIAEPLRALYHPSHLTYFTPRSLMRLLERQGAADIVLRCKEAHITRFGAGGYRPLARAAIRTAAGLDRLLGTEAKLLVAFRRGE